MTLSITIREYLKSENIQRSAKEIFEKAKEENSNLKIESVYAIMKKLTKRKLVMKIRSDKTYYCWAKEKLINKRV